MGSSAAESTLEWQPLCYSYGDRGAFLLEVGAGSVAAGERVACTGPSGSGKTTLLHLFAGILLPKRGSVAACGLSWDRVRDAARRRHRIQRVGLVFQAFELLEHLTVLENVLLPFHLNRAQPLTPAARERGLALLARAGIVDDRDRKPQYLSQGERQRVALCRALVTEPDLVLADEPTGNLDPETTERILALLLEETGARGAALVLVTHDHGLLPSFDRRLTFTREGTRARVAAA